MKRAVQRTPTESGFTIVEIAVVVPILMVIALALFQFLFLMAQASTEESTRINLAYEKQAAMDEIESDVRLTSAFVPTLDPNMVDHYQQNQKTGGVWNYKGDGTIRTLILRMYATTQNPDSINRGAIYIGDSTKPECSMANISANDVQTYNMIYFVYNQTLYRRHATDITTKTCDPQYQKISCPPADVLTTMGVGTKSTDCKADDEVIATNVTGFDVQYYSDGGSSTPLDAYNASADPTIVSGARSVDVHLTQTRRASSGPISSDIDLRIATINTGGN